MISAPPLTITNPWINTTRADQAVEVDTIRILYTVSEIFYRYIWFFYIPVYVKAIHQYRLFLFSNYLALNFPIFVTFVFFANVCRKMGISESCVSLWLWNSWWFVRRVRPPSSPPTSIYPLFGAGKCNLQINSEGLWFTSESLINSYSLLEWVISA